MRSLAIFGAGDHGKVVAEAAKLQGWTDITFFDDNSNDSSFHDFNYGGTFKALLKNKKNFDGFHVAIGQNKYRKIFLEKLIELDLKVVSIIHPSSVISDTAKLESGVSILSGVIVGSYSKIKKGVILNSGCIIDHNSIIGQYCHISPGSSIAGNVTIGELSWIGIGSSIINNIQITSEVLIGAGSVVTEVIKTRGTYVGVPVKKIK